jgi:5-(carboxyamino)imidazole ribonucleotide mutase
MQVAIIFGSGSDREVMKKAAEVLRDFGVSFDARIISAHRAPELLARTVREIEAAGCRVIIAGAGLAAALPGVIASQTALPVIGVPVSSPGLGGLDALFSIVQMPRPVPVAAVGIDNAANAAWLACEILALGDEKLRKQIVEKRAEMEKAFSESAAGVEL